MKDKLYITITNNISYDQRINRIATSLSSMYDVTVLGTTTRNPPKLTIKQFKQKRLFTFFKTGKFFYLEFNLRLIFFFIFRKVNHLYTVDLDTMLAGIFIKKIKNSNWVFDAHEYFTELPELENRPKTKQIWNRIAFKGIPLTDVRFTVNEVLAEQLSAKYKMSFDYVRNMPMLLKNQSERSKEKIILYQGAINIGRGIEEMIQAMSLLPNYRLMLCGSGPDLDRLKNNLSINMHQNVEFLGMKRPEELREITEIAFVGLNLLQGESKNYYYSLANKFFDYTMAEIPSINMNFPAYVKLNEQYQVAILVEDLKVDTLVKAIRKLEDQIYYDQLKDECRKAKIHWNWDLEEKKLMNLLA